MVLLMVKDGDTFLFDVDYVHCFEQLSDSGPMYLSLCNASRSCFVNVIVLYILFFFDIHGFPTF